MNEAVEQLIARYRPNSQQDYENALKEVLQEIILLGLDRVGFFEKAAFYGGTALRIFHGLDRFSEDIDFTLLKPDRRFQLKKYFSGLKRELEAFDFQFELEQVEKPEERMTESAFLKANTQLLFLKIHGAKAFAKHVHREQKLKIKFEVDVEPAISFQTEIKTLLLPSPFSVRLLDLPDLFAGKVHAALLRNWKGRIKGRDFYDLQWYLARNIPIRKTYLEEKLTASGALKGALTRERLIELLTKRIDSIDWERAKSDVLPFLKDKTQVRLWSAPFFKALIERIALA